MELRDEFSGEKTYFKEENTKDDPGVGGPFVCVLLSLVINKESAWSERAELR